MHVDITSGDMVTHTCGPRIKTVCDTIFYFKHINICFKTICVWKKYILSDVLYYW
jgi:hypothetical protein